MGKVEAENRNKLKEFEQKLVEFKESQIEPIKKVLTRIAKLIEGKPEDKVLSMH